MLRLGMFDDASRIAALPDPPQAQRRELVRKVTQESMVLLKNEGGMLPLQSAALRSIAVIGPLADTVALDWYSGTPFAPVTPLAGIPNRAGVGVTVSYASGEDLTKAAETARSADVSIVGIGNHPTCNAGWMKCAVASDGKEAMDCRSLMREQESIAQAVFAANPNTIVVLQSSFPFTTNWTQEHIPAIIEMAHNSEEQGTALADVLFGDYNPAGRLTQTWVASMDDLPPMMDYDLRHGRTYLYAKTRPLYASGFGLSYTSFTYAGLRQSSPTLRAGGQISVAVQLKNAGPSEGDEAVQLYVSHQTSSVVRPLEELKGFARVQLKSGETRTVTLPLPASALTYWSDSAGKFVLETDEVELRIGGSSNNLPLHQLIKVVP